MSRCFPFPPPGYEKKATIDDPGLLTKEKDKEKKHKKDRKEKEKKEGKEKKDKDRSKERYKEKKEKHIDKEKERDKEKKQVSDEKRFEGQPEFHNGRKLIFDSLPDKEINDSRCVQELVKRIREEERVSCSQMVQKIIAQEQQRAEVQGKAVDNLAYYQNEEQHKFSYKNEDCKEVNGERNHIDARGLKKTFGQRFLVAGQKRIEGITKLVEKIDNKKAIDGKEKSKHKEHNNKDNKYKHRDHEKDLKSKNKERDKEKKKEEKKREVNESTKDQPKLKDRSPQLKESSKDTLDFRIPQPSDAARLGCPDSVVEGNFGKRKESEINGYVHGNEDRPNKLVRHISSSNLAIENGRKLEPCQSAIQCASEKQVLVRVDVKESKINGSMATGQPIMCKPTQCSDSIPAKENSEAYKKPPHPDLKYLNQILSVPTMDEWLDCCDQEWLFSSAVKSKKIGSASSVSNEAPQVWAEAQQIESEDSVALPYVIPY